MRWLGMMLLTVAGIMGGCSKYVEDYRFEPRPAMAEIPATTQGVPSPVSTMASIVGVRYADKKANLPQSIEVRVRVDNNGAGTVLLDPHKMELNNALFFNFDAPLVDPQSQMTIAAGQSAVVAAWFPFPAGHDYYNVDLTALQLRWELTVDGRSIRQVINFTRVYPYYYYYDPYYNRPYWWGPQTGVFVHIDDHHHH